MKIAKTFDFDAAHRLTKVPVGHKCATMHGHTYRVEVVVDGVVRDDGFVLDYADIATAWAPLQQVLDHQTLNEIPGLENPTTEVLVDWLLARLPAWVTTIRVYESTTTWVEGSR